MSPVYTGRWIECLSFLADPNPTIQELPPIDLLPPLLYEPADDDTSTVSMLLLDAGASMLALPTTCLGGGGGMRIAVGGDAGGQPDQGRGEGRGAAHVPPDVVEALRSQVILVRLS